MSNLTSNPNVCEECGEPATQWMLRDPFGKSDAKRPLCGKHGMRLRDPEDVATIERLTRHLWWVRRLAGTAAMDPHDNEASLEAVREYLAEVLSERGLGHETNCQHDLLLPNPTVDVDRDGMGGTCRACHQTWSFRRAEKTQDG